jgi:hypothetical protein
MKQPCQGNTHGYPFPVSEQFEISANRACLHYFQTTNSRHDKDRIETVKGGLLKDAYNCILEQAESIGWRYEQHIQLLWIG